MALAYEKDLTATETGIEGLVVLDLPVHGDNRGWFKENWQRAKMALGLGLPDLRWVQNNISFNTERGATRGIHAEPWNKFISIATGSIFGAWVDLRAGSPTYGSVYTCELDPSKAIYVPRGVGNAYQALEDGTRVRLSGRRPLVRRAQEDLHVREPCRSRAGHSVALPLEECEISEADRNHPFLKDVVPMEPKRTLVTGANGQLGRAIRSLAQERGLTGFDYCDIDTFDMSDAAAYDRYDWDLYGTVINCGAYTAVDRAETPEGRVLAWKANAQGRRFWRASAPRHGITLVHISSDYVFDGTAEAHSEDEPFSPLSVYGQSKAAGDIAVAGCPAHYILRSSWVIGDGRNFVRTMEALSARCARPRGRALGGHRGRRSGRPAHLHG